MMSRNPKKKKSIAKDLMKQGKRIVSKQLIEQPMEARPHTKRTIPENAHGKY